MVQAGLLEILNRLLISQGCLLILFLLVVHGKVICVLGNLHFPLQVRAVQHCQYLVLFNLVAFLYVHGHDFSMYVGYHIHAVGAGHRTAEGQLLLYGLFCQRRHIHHDSRALAAAPKL